MTPPADRPPRRDGGGSKRGGKPPRPRGNKGSGAKKRAGDRTPPSKRSGGAQRGGPAKRSGGAGKRSGGAQRGGPAKRSGGAGKRSGGAQRGGPAKRSGGTSRGRGREETTKGKGAESSRPGDGRRPPRRGDRDEPVDPRTKQWGRVARRGAAHLTDAGASKAFREAAEEERTVDWEPEQWVDEGPVRAEAEDAVRRGRSEAGRESPRPEADPDTSKLSRALPGKRAEHATRDVKRAAKEFQRDHFKEAEKLLKPLVEIVPNDVTVRELYGLTLYRLERWKSATQHLERFAELTASVEQHPVLADCRRALGHHHKVAELWDELREQQAPASIMAEGRIVYAGDLADQGKLREAIREMERSSYEAKRPKDHHLRLRYVLADLYERAGDLPRARELFESIARHDPGFADVSPRLRNLG